MVIDFHELLNKLPSFCYSVTFQPVVPFLSLSFNVPSQTFTEWLKEAYNV